jgi:integrase
VKITEEVLKDGSKRYWCRVTEKGVNRKLRASTQTELKRKHRAIKERESLRKLGIRDHQGPITYGELRAEFEPLYNPGAERSRVTLAERLTYSKPLDSVYVRDMTPAVVQRWLVGLKRTRGKRKGEALTPTTQRHALNVLRLVLDFGVEMQYLERNPARSRSVRPSRMRARTIRPLTSWQEVFLVADKAGGKDGALIRFACASGLRPQEWQALPWTDVSFRDNECRVWETVSNGEVVEGQGKTEASLRTVKLNKIAMDALRDLGADRLKGGLVFRSPTGGRIDLTNWRNRVFYPALDAAGLTRRWPSEMRHTYATLSISARPELLAWVSKQMGHTNIKTTTQKYRAWLPHEDTDNVAAINAAIEESLNRDRPKSDPLEDASEQ